jgi:hypothetical protein
VKSTIEEAIEEYNKYRRPEVTAELLKVGKESYRIRFTGGFCTTCGFYDYFDDFWILLEDEHNIESEVDDIEEILNGAEVTFSLL